MISENNIVHGQYRLMRDLGGGSLGRVFLAEELISGMQVAIKVLTERGTELQNSFHQEARIMAQMHHRHILQLFGAFSENNHHFLVTEYCSGGNLQEHLKQHVLSESEAMVLVRQIAEGLHYAHNFRLDADHTGLVHCDLKPQNILLDADGIVKIGDFGISRIAKASGRLDLPMGMPEYMAPEQFEGAYDQRIDLYALGIILLQMLTGRTPFTGSFATIVKRQLFEEVDLPEHISKPMQKILRLLLAKNPEERAFSALQVLEHLEKLRKKIAGNQPIDAAQNQVLLTVAEGSSTTAEPSSAAGNGAHVPSIDHHAERQQCGSLQQFKPFVEKHWRKLLSILFALILTAILLTSQFKKSRQSKIIEIPTIFVEGGTFDMGDVFNDGVPDAKPVHQVTLNGFYLGTTEVTVGQYREFCSQTGYLMPEPPPWGWSNNLPMVNVTWQDADSFCSWAGYRLPTEAEWEFAARARGAKFRFGNSQDVADPNEINFDARANLAQSYSHTGIYRQRVVAVQTFGPNVLGFYDMSGNVWEWCADWYGEDYYSTSPAHNPTGPISGNFRTLRGGSWRNDPGRCRTIFRLHSFPQQRLDNVGFRVARSR